MYYWTSMSKEWRLCAKGCALWQGPTRWLSIGWFSASKCVYMCVCVCALVYVWLCVAVCSCRFVYVCSLRGSGSLPLIRFKIVITEKWTCVCLRSSGCESCPRHRRFCHTVVNSWSRSVQPDPGRAVTRAGDSPAGRWPAETGPSSSSRPVNLFRADRYVLMKTCLLVYHFWQTITFILTSYLGLSGGAFDFKW